MLRCIRDVRAISARHAILFKIGRARSAGVKSANRQIIRLPLQAERHTAYQHFYQAFVFIVEDLEMIGFKRHLPKYGDMYADWDPANRNEAQQMLASITSFEFIVVFMTMYQYLAHLAGITVKLQTATVGGP